MREPRPLPIGELSRRTGVHIETIRYYEKIRMLPLPPRTEGGRRVTIKYVEAPVAANKWHTLRAEFAALSIRIMLDGTLVISIDDAHIRGPGAAGVWTKADSVTAFDDFACGTAAS